MNKLKDFIIWFAGTLILMVMIWIGIKYNIGFLTFIGILALIFVQIIGVVSLIQLKDDRKQQ